jgi:hypothetical protein
MIFSKRTQLSSIPRSIPVASIRMWPIDLSCDWEVASASNGGQYYADP